MQQLEAGAIVDGKVTGITKFGVFVDIGDGKTDRPTGGEWKAKSSDSMSFEDMMSHFKQTSDDKMSDLKRKNYGDVKRTKRPQR